MQTTRKPRQPQPRSLRFTPAADDMAAVLGLTGEIVQPVAKGKGVRVIEDRGTYRVEPLAQ